MCFWTAWSSHQTLQSSVRGLANLQSSSEVRILRCSLPSSLPTLLPLLFFFSSIPFFISSFLLPSTFSLLLSSSLSYSLLSCSSHSLLLYFFFFSLPLPHLCPALWNEIRLVAVQTPIKSGHSVTFIGKCLIASRSCQVCHQGIPTTECFSLSCGCHPPPSHYPFFCTLTSLLVSWHPFWSALVILFTHRTQLDEFWVD